MNKHSIHCNFIYSTKSQNNPNSKHKMENPGVDPGPSRMQSERSTRWANSPTHHFKWDSALSQCIIQSDDTETIHAWQDPKSTNTDSIFSRVAQRKRAGPITQRSVDRNNPLLHSNKIYAQITEFTLRVNFTLAWKFLVSSFENVDSATTDSSVGRAEDCRC